MAGFVCADLSSAGSGTELEGVKSAPTYHALLQTLGWLQHEQRHALAPLYFIENTVHHTATPRAVVKAFEMLRSSIGQEVTLDAARVGSFAHRLRSYWSNLCDANSLQMVLDTYERDPSLRLKQVLNDGHTPQRCTAARKPPWYPADVIGKKYRVLPTLVARHGSWNWSCFTKADGSVHTGQGLVWDNGSLVDLTLEERERVMGYPTG